MGAFPGDVHVHLESFGVLLRQVQRGRRGAFEQAARDRKIFAIIAKLDQINCGPVHYEETSKLTEKEWASIAKLAGVNRPSAKTVAEILAILQARAVSK